MALEESSSETPLPISLYVGDLHEEVEEANLFNIFKQVGPVQSIKVCRDNQSRKSLGYAYVNYENHADAQQAMDEFNYDVVMGRSMRIMWCQRDSSKRRSSKSNVVVKGLPKRIDSKQLHDLFKGFGEILSSKVCCNREGVSKGYAFVHYKTVESAEQAISTLNNKVMDDKRVQVELWASREDRGNPHGDNNSNYHQSEDTFTNVFVKNFADKLDEDKLKEMFSEHGRVISCAVMREENGKSKGFGFVAMANHEAALKAVNKLNGTLVEDQKIYVGRAQRKEERMLIDDGCNLYVKNIDDFVTDEQFRSAFASFGAIKSCKIMRDEEGRSKGFGFVSYQLKSSGGEAIRQLNNYPLFSHDKQLVVCHHQKKEERIKMLATMNMNRQFSAQPAMNGVYANHFPRMPVSLHMNPLVTPAQPPINPMPNMMACQQMPLPPTPQPISMQGLNEALPPVMSGIEKLSDFHHLPTNKPVHLMTPQENQQLRREKRMAVRRMNTEQRRDFLGGLIYPQVLTLQQGNDRLAGKITGMLLELEESEVVELVTNQKILTSRNNEALRVLETSGYQIKPQPDQNGARIAA